MERKTFLKKMVTGLLVVAAAIVYAVIPAAVLANDNIPVTIDIPLTYIVNGNDKIAGGDTVTLEPDIPGAPMPADSEGGKKTITLKNEGTYSFGPMYFDRPEVWWYTITRNVREKKGVKKDDSVYRAKVIALNDGHGYVLVYREGSDEKQELVYEDRTTPDTGDTDEMTVYVIIMAAAAVSLVVITAAKLRQAREKGRH